MTHCLKNMEWDTGKHSDTFRNAQTRTSRECLHWKKKNKKKKQTNK